MRTILLIALAAALALAGCASNTPSTTTPTTSTTAATPTPTTGGAPPTLAYVATQSTTGGNATYKFDGASTAAPGWTTFKLTNQGTEPHQITVIKLAAGETMMAHQMMMQDPNASMGGHANATYVGGVGIAMPGGNASTTVHLAVGTYVIECDIPGPTGAPHAMMGMMKELTVSGADTGAKEPTADLTLTLKEFQFNWSAKPTVGHHVVKIVNVGTMPHEGPVFALAQNKTMMDFIHWISSGNQTPQGPPPITGAFGGAAITPGQVEYADETFGVGDYGLACFLPDTQGRPHVADGMVDQFTVA